MNSIPILVNFWITIVLINGERHLKMKMVNQENKTMYVVENFNYYSIDNFLNRPDWGMSIALQNFDFNHRIKRRIISRPKKLTAVFISLDSNTLDNRKYQSKKLSRSIFWSYPQTIAYMTKKINRQSKIHLLKSSDSLVHYIRLQDNVFLKSSYCKVESQEECLPIEVDSLQMFGRLMFRYSFKADEKPKNFSYFILDSDTVKFKIE